MTNEQLRVLMYCFRQCRTTRLLNGSKLFIFGMVVCSFVGVFSVGGDIGATQTLEILRQRLVGRVRNIDARLAPANRDDLATGLANLGLTMLALGGDTKKAESAYEKAFALQNLDPASADYGRMPPRVGRRGTYDDNTIEFVTWWLDAGLLDYRARVSAQFKEGITTHARAAAAAITRHNPPIGYTNIYLMKTANLISLGEILRNDTLVEQGKRCLSDWVSFTRTNGITEYDSPTYAALQLACLGQIYRHPPDENTRSVIKAALEYEWCDLSVNFFPPRQRLSGPHSRSYDFLFGKEPVNYDYCLEGFSTDLAGEDELGGVWLAPRSDSYHPSESCRVLATLPDRIIEQSFGDQPDQTRYNYITPDFAVGSVSSCYSRQDVQVSIDLASPKQLPTISAIASDSDTPYGSAADLAAGKATKAHHLRNAISATQQRGMLLALLNLQSADDESNKEVIATNISVPLAADEVLLDGKTLHQGGAIQPASTSSILYIRERTAAVAVRIFRVDGCDGYSPVLELHGDSSGLNLGRLVAYHYRGPAKQIKERAIRAGVLLAVRRCVDDEAFKRFRHDFEKAEIRENMAGPVWTVSASVNSTTLESALDLVHNRAVNRRVNGKLVNYKGLRLNGEDLGAKIWNKN